MTDLRKAYLAKLYDKVRHLSNPDIDNAQWERDELNDSPHEGESKVEHEMEMWASTASKGNRKRYKDMVEGWQKKGDADKETQEESKQAQEEPVHEEKHVENTETVPVDVAEEHLNRDQNEHVEQDQGGDVDKSDGQESNDLWAVEHNVEMKAECNVFPYKFDASHPVTKYEQQCFICVVSVTLCSVVLYAIISDITLCLISSVIFSATLSSM